MGVNCGRVVKIRILKQEVPYKCFYIFLGAINIYVN